MALFKKKSFRPPEVAETTIGLAGNDVMFLCQNLGYNEPEDTYQEAWSEYMKVQYALTLLVIADKRPDIIDQYSQWLKDSTIARLKAGVDTDILRDAVSKESWFENARHYQELPIGDIPNELYRKLAPLLPVSIGDEEEASIRRYLEERIPFIYKSLMKLNFEV